MRMTSITNCFRSDSACGDPLALVGAAKICRTKVGLDSLTARSRNSAFATIGQSALRPLLPLSEVARLLQSRRDAYGRLGRIAPRHGSPWQ
jgi:hypothetical protein